LLQDLKNGDLELIPLDGQFLVGQTVDHRFKSPDDGQEYWYTGRVLAFEPVTKKHTIEYQYDSTTDDDDDEPDDPADSVFEEPLLDDYVSGDVRILV
jgi:hypothetical protein